MDFQGLIQRFKAPNVILCQVRYLIVTLIRDYHIHSRLVGLSPASVPTLSLKGPQMGDDTIYPELLRTASGVVGTIYLGVGNPKTRKTLR